MSTERMVETLASWSLRRRRKALRLYWQAERLRGRLPDYGLAGIFRDNLRLGAVAARHMNEEAVFHDWLVSLEWLAILRRSAVQLRADLNQVRLPSEHNLAQVAESGRPVILAPIHMGCFALGLARIMDTYFADRPMLILRAREDRPLETEAMRRVSEIGVDMRFLNIADKQAYVDAVRFARKGAVVVMFVDLPGAYGGPVRTRLLRRDVEVALGIDSLARLTEASVIPLRVASSTEGDEIHFGRSFESLASGPNERARVASLVARHVEQDLQAAPEQWLMWQRFEEFLITYEDFEAVA